MNAVATNRRPGVAAAILLVAVALAVLLSLGAKDAAPTQAAGEDTIASAAALPADQYGIADENASSLRDPRFRSLGVTKVRLQVPWDLMARKLDAGSPTDPSPTDPDRVPVDPDLNQAWRDTRDYLDAAKELNLEVAISLKPSPKYKNALPKAIKYKRAVNKLRKWLYRRGYNVQYFMPWNEPNLTEPTKSNSRRAGHYFRALSNLCAKPPAGLPTCTAIAGDFLLDRDLTRGYLGGYKKGAKMRPKIWAVHPYSDGQNLNHKYLKAFLKKTHESTDVWFSEAGGIIRGGDTNQSPQEACRRLRYLLRKLVSYSAPGQRHRITRFYVYQFKGEASPDWDSGLIGPDDKTRDMYNQMLARPNPPRCP